MAALDAAGRPALMHAAASNRHDAMLLLLLQLDRVDVSVADITHGRRGRCGCLTGLWTCLHRQ